jgi:hypothetical protein
MTWRQEKEGRGNSGQGVQHDDDDDGGGGGGGGERGLAAPAWVVAE